MSLAHQVFDQAVRPLSRPEQLRLAALILQNLADEGIDSSDDLEDAEARARAERLTPRSADLRRLIAEGIRPAVWHDDDEPLF